jgi:hypothetical protein
MTALIPLGVIESNLALAPPLKHIVGWPEGRFATPISLKNTPRLMPVPRALERLHSATRCLALLDFRKDPLDKTLPVPLQRTLDAAYVNQIATNAKYHVFSFPRQNTQIQGFVL